MAHPLTHPQDGSTCLGCNPLAILALEIAPALMHPATSCCDVDAVGCIACNGALAELGKFMHKLVGYITLYNPEQDRIATCVRHSFIETTCTENTMMLGICPTTRMHTTGAGIPRSLVAPRTWVSLHCVPVLVVNPLVHASDGAWHACQKQEGWEPDY